MVIGHVVTTELSRAQLWKRITVLGTPHNFVDASLRHVVLSICHASPRCFFKKNYRVIEVSRITRHKFSALETCFNAHTAGGQTLPLSTQRSSSTPAGGHPHPSPPSDHSGSTLPCHPAVMVVKFSPPTRVQ